MGYPLLVILKTCRGKIATYMSLCFGKKEGLQVVIILYKNRYLLFCVESTSNNKFILWLKALKNSRMLWGLVINKAHNIIVSCNYQATFHSLRLLVQVNAPDHNVNGYAQPNVGIGKELDSNNISQNPKEWTCLTQRGCETSLSDSCNNIYCGKREQTTKMLVLTDGKYKRLLPTNTDNHWWSNERQSRDQ